jgi:prepilin-type N-terminal cleavage/methylation domain-containing protein
MLRRGYSLIEIIVVLTIGTVVVGIGVGMLHLLLRTEQSGRDRVPQARAVARLAEQFRSDAAAAMRQASGSPPGEWRFVLPENRLVTYRALPGEVQWDERLAGKLLRRESYLLPGGSSAAISVQGKAAPAMASLVIVNDGPPPAAGHEMRVIAVLGKDHRFTGSPAEGQ